MLSNDRKLKNIRFSYNDKVQGTSRTINLIEHDNIDLKYYGDDGKVVHSYGEIIKIGEHSDTGVKYIIVIDYDYYNDDNIHSIDLNKLYTIINVTHSSTSYSFSPVYCADETVPLIKADDDGLKYTTDGKVWKTISGGGGSDITIEDVDHEIEGYLGDYSKTEEVDEKISSAVNGLASQEYVNTTLEAYSTTEEVEEKISTATEGLASREDLNTALEAYSTTEQVEEKISDATENMVTTAMLEHYSTTEQVQSRIDTAVEGLASKEELEAYSTTEQVDEKISTATEGLATKEELEAYSTTEEVEEKIATATENLVDQETLEAYSTTEEVDEKISNATDNLVDNDTLDEVVTELEGKFSGAFHFKGVVETEADLANIENPSEGDVYQVTHAEGGDNAEFAFNGSEWVNLGMLIDLSNYYTKEEIDEAIQAAYDDAVEEAKNYTEERLESFDLYKKCKELGYLGDEDTFYASLVDVLNHTNVIPVVDNQEDQENNH